MVCRWVSGNYNQIVTLFLLQPFQNCLCVDVHIAGYILLGFTVKFYMAPLSVHRNLW